MEIKSGDTIITRISKEPIILEDKDFALIASLDKLTNAINKLVEVTA